MDITPHHPRHWPERVIFGNQKPSKQIESLGQDVFSRSGQPVAFTLTEGTFLTLPPSSLTVVIPPLIAVITPALVERLAGLGLDDLLANATSA